MDYFIIEHLTRGTLMELDAGKQAGGRFAWSGLRSDAWRLPSLEHARNVRAQLSPKVSNECYILSSVGWERVD